MKKKVLNALISVSNKSELIPIIKILKNLEVVTAYSSNVATAKQFYDAGLDLIKPVGDDAKQIRGLKMNRVARGSRRLLLCFFVFIFRLFFFHFSIST